jgi:ABC-type glycerol-3-phosphate transport system substrate-binding protein
MNNAGCFEPGVAGTTAGSANALFAQGQGLILLGGGGGYAAVAAAGPQFRFSLHPNPFGSKPDQTSTFVNPAQNAVGINAHSSPQAQAAAQTFVDFLARPKQDALYAKLTGTLTQYQVSHAQLWPYMSQDLTTMFATQHYVVDPGEGFWNPDVKVPLSQGIGLLTGQLSIDDILNAMDTAWKKGPE